MGNANSYTPNKVYWNSEHNIYYYINSKGYMHVLKICAVRADGCVKYYTIKDLMLTNKNTLKDKGNQGMYSTFEGAKYEIERRYLSSI